MASKIRYFVTLLMSCSLLMASLQIASASPSAYSIGNDSQIFSGSPISNITGSFSNVSNRVVGTASSGVMRAMNSPMPLAGFQATLINTVMTATTQTGVSVGGMIGNAAFGQTGAGIGAALGSRIGSSVGAGLLSGNTSNIRMPWSGSNPIPGAILGGFLGNILSRSGFQIPSINIPGLGGAANSALNGAVGGAIGGALGSAIGGGNIGQGAVQGAIGGAAGGILGSALSGAGMGSGMNMGMGSGMGMGMGGFGSMGRAGPDGFPSSVPRMGGMPNMRNPMNGGTTNPFGSMNNPLGNITNIFGQGLLNVVVQSLLQQLGIPTGGFGQQMAQMGAAGAMGSMMQGAGFQGNGFPGTFSGAIANRVGESTFNVPGTNNGNVACAWVVNDVYRQMTGNTITGTYGQPGSSNMLVKDTIAAMQSNPQAFRQVTQAEAIASGQDYIIASNYNYGSNGSHIGWGNGNRVWSNSSGSASIQNNYTPSGWQNYFGQTMYFIPTR